MVAVDGGSGCDGRYVGNGSSGEVEEVGNDSGEVEGKVTVKCWWPTARELTS